MKNKLTHSAGFTLVELLATIVILGILIAIAVPSISSLTERSRLGADQASVGMLNSATSLARLGEDDSGIFTDSSTSEEELIRYLFTEGYLEAEVQPQSRDAAFVFENERWNLFIGGSLVEDSSTHYLLTESDFRTSGHTGSITITEFLKVGEKNIRIPEGIRHIGGHAFSNQELESVILPISLEEIRAHGFQENNIQEITIPNNVQHIRNSAFYNNPITRITMTSDPDQVVIQDRAFGIGYTESKIFTDAFREAYVSGGPGTYEWVENRWIKAD